MIIKYYFLSMVCCFAAFATCQQVKSGPGKPAGKKAVAEIYSEFCGGCHGRQLQHFKLLKSHEKLSTSELAHAIRAGNEETGMPAFGASLDEDMIDKLAQFIKNYNYSKNHVADNKEDKAYRSEVIVDGLTIPWGLEFLPNGDLLIAERNGQLSRFSTEEGLLPVSGLPPVRDRGQGGLMDLKLHPDYEQNGWLYIAYVYIDEIDSQAGNTAIIRGKIKDNKLVDIQEIFRATPAVTTNHHFGCRMAFDREGYLYFSVGDRGQRDVFPQKLDNANGKIHRLHDDGSTPSDNPFIDRQGAVASIFSYGHRNPQGVAMHPVTGKIWTHEHGPKGGDEINVIKKGANYGWPVISYGVNYSGTKFTDITEKEGMEQPVHYYKPSIAPCGMAFITTDKYPGWQNSLLIGSLSFSYLERLELYGEQVVYQEKLLKELGSRVRNVKISPDGFIYVAVERPGRIVKLIPVKE